MRLTLAVALLLLAACAPPARQTEVFFPSDFLSIAGTLYLPADAGRHPAVILVHGSGPQDRAPYVPLAREFARHGIAALIYDKRGVGGSTGGWEQSPFRAIAEDAAAGIRFLRTHPEIYASRVGIWGGSEGGWIAPWVASEDSTIAFVIVQSAPVVRAADQHLFQVDQFLRGLGATPTELEAGRRYVQMQHRFSATREGWEEYVEALIANRASPVLSQLGGPLTADEYWWAWWKTKMEFDPIPAWERVKAPVFAAWGEHDALVPVEESWRALEGALARGGNEQGEFLMFPNHDHDLSPTGLGRVWVLYPRLFLGRPGYTPAMGEMARWAADVVADPRRDSRRLKAPLGDAP
jgi:dipeptidyl aminopeptidase/acylaminoacyl peptidase